MEKKGIFFEINLNVFPLPIYVSLGQTPDEIINQLNLDPGTDYDELYEVLDNQECSAAQTLHLSSGVTLVYLYEIPKTLVEISTIVHEASHASDFVLERMGIPIDLEGTETRAYVLAYIVESILKHFHNSKLVLEPVAEKLKIKKAAAKKIIKKTIKKKKKLSNKK